MTTKERDIVKSNKVERLMCGAQSVDPSAIITYIALGDPLSQPQYIVCLMDISGLVEYSKEILSLYEFKQFMKTNFYHKSCTITSSRCIPAKLYVRESGVLRETVDNIGCSSILFRGRRNPIWKEQRLNLGDGVSSFLSIMKNINNISEISAENMQTFLNFVKKYNFDINWKTPAPLLMQLEDMPKEGFNLHRKITEINDSNEEYSLLVRFLNSHSNKKIWLRALVDQLLLVQRAHVEQMIFGCSSTDKSINFANSICAYLGSKPIYLMFKDFTLSLYEKWNEISDGIPEEYNCLWDFEDVD